MDEDGKVVFFIGGQINCSTTIHNRADVVRVLSISDEPEAEDPTLASSSTQDRKHGRGFFKAFRTRNSSTKSPTRQETGMEQGLINRIEKMNLKNQMRMFYSAYSKVRSPAISSPPCITAP